MCIHTVDPPTDKAASYVTILRILIVCQLIVAVLDILSTQYFIKHGVYGIFLCSTLFLSQRILSYQILLINIILGLYFTMDFFFAFLTFFQNGTNVTQSTDTLKFQFAVIIISLIHYVIVSIFAYYPYKEFKRISYRNNPALNHIFNQNLQTEPSQKGKIVPYQPAYGDIPINPKHRNNDHGTFEVTRGQGIKM